MSLQEISNIIGVKKDYPEKGMYFRDIEWLLINPDLYDSATNMMVELIKNEPIDYVLGFESRGFIFGQTIASKLHKGFAMLKKSAKNDNILTIQAGLLPQGSNVLLVDDLIATGGSFLAGCDLMKRISCNVVACLCLVELVGLQKRKGLEDYNICSVIKYPSDREDKCISKDEEILFKHPVEYLPEVSKQQFDNKIVIFSHPSMKEISDNIIMFSKYFKDGGIKWSHSSDNYPLITFENLKYLINKRVVFFGSLYNRANFSEQLSLLTRLPKCTIKSLDIIIPYFAPGLNLSVNSENNNSLSTAKSYAKIISKCLVTTQDGPPRIHIFDINSNDVESWFSDSAIVNVDTAVTLVRDKIKRNDTTIIFPTKQIEDRYFNYFSEFRIYNIETKNKINWPSIGYDDKCLDDILIVNDCIQTGEVLEECRIKMIELGAKKISAYITHAVFPNGSYKNSMFENFNKIYVTNSIPEITKRIVKKHPFEVLKLDDLIRDKLLNLFDISTTEMIIPKQYNVYVSSENKTKLKATYDAIDYILKSCENDEYNLKVYGINVPSGVSEQPVNDETLVGCQNRLNNLRKYLETKQLEYDFIVSIESGAYWENELNTNSIVHDKCQVMVLAKANENTAISQKLSTLATICPTQFAMESMSTNKTQTIGSLIEKAYGFRAGSWHEHFDTKITRYEMIFNTIVEIFGKTFEKHI